MCDQDTDGCPKRVCDAIGEFIKDAQIVSEPLNGSTRKGLSRTSTQENLPKREHSPNSLAVVNCFIELKPIQAKLK